MNRGGVIEKILLAIFVAAVFLAQANPLLSLAPPEEAIISSAGQSPPAEGELTLTTAAEIALRHNPLLQATSSAEEFAARGPASQPRDIITSKWVHNERFVSAERGAIPFLP